jgi:hypothetical protein
MEAQQHGARSGSAYFSAIRIVAIGAELKPTQSIT